VVDVPYDRPVRVERRAVDERESRAANGPDWDRYADEYQATHGEFLGDAGFVWGPEGLTEAEAGILGDVAGKDVLELGCGTAYFSSWLARRGARVVGVDVTPEQLETAGAMQREFELDFPLIEANAEDVPLPDESFDIAFSEYGASIWCDPNKWIPEAARLLRPGGLLAFLVNGTILVLCWPDDDYADSKLVRPYFGLFRQEDSGDGSINFHIGYGEWIRVLRSSGFDVEDMIEVQAPEDAVEHPLMEIKPEWGRRWPADEIWKARKR